MYQLYTLKNGLRVVAEKNNSVNSISVGVMIQNGSRNENIKTNGISHFIEHMMFKGTEKRSAKEIVETIENVGGQINAFTSKEATCYYVKALHTHLDLSIDILSDMLLNSKFDEKEIEREKKVVIEEINMNEDSPEDVLYELHSKAIFNDNSLAYPILGTIDRINSLTRDDIVSFIKEKYTPYNSVISICGKFDEKELMGLLEQYFSDWTSEEKYIPIYDKIDINTQVFSANKDIEQLHINLGLKGFPAGHKKAYPLMLLSNLFGGGASSVLFQKIREELGLCYNIYCYTQTYQGVGVVNIYSGLAKDSGVKALEVIKDELYKFSQNGITDGVLKINKEKLKAHYVLGLESTSSKMFSNAKSILFKNKVHTEEEIMKKIDNITSEDIEYVLKECFEKGIMNAAYVGNDIDEQSLNNVIFNA